MDIPKNIRNNFDFLLSGVYSENDGLKWVNLYNYKLLVLKNFTLCYFHPLEIFYYNDMFLYSIKNK